MSTDMNKSTEKRETVAEYIRMYYEHQYDRVVRLEEQALTITNVVVTLCVVAFTFGFSNAQGLNVIAAIGLSIVMILANLFAVFYTIRTSSWIETHGLRAKRVLKDYSPALHELDKTTFAPYPTGILGTARRKIQIALHVLLGIVSALIPLILYAR